MSTKRDLFYYQRSREADAVAVRELIWEWGKEGASRNFPSDADYLSDPTVYKKAAEKLGMEFEDEPIS